MVTGLGATPAAPILTAAVAGPPPIKGISERQTTSLDGRTLGHWPAKKAPEVTGTLRLSAAMNAASPKNRSRISRHRVGSWGIGSARCARLSEWRLQSGDPA